MQSIVLASTADCVIGIYVLYSYTVNAHKIQKGVSCLGRAARREVLMLLGPTSSMIPLSYKSL